MEIGDSIPCGHWLDGGCLRRVGTANPDQFSCEGRANAAVVLSSGAIASLGVACVAVVLYRYLISPQEFSTAWSLVVALTFLASGVLLGIHGCQLMCRRFGFIVDRAEGTCVTWETRRFRRFQRERKLDEFNRVYVGKTRFEHSFLISLQGRDWPLRLTSPRAELEARALGEQIADFLGLGFIGEPMTFSEWIPGSESGHGDGTRVSASVCLVENTSALREAGTLQESLRDRVRRTGIPAVPDRPSSARSNLRSEATAVSFTIPPTRFSKEMQFDVLASIVVYGLLGGLVVNIAAKCYSTGISVFWEAASICGLLAACVNLGLVIMRLTQHVTLNVDLRTLRVTTQRLWNRVVCEIPITELEELRLERDCLAAFSDRAVARFGDGLGDDERKWMRTLIIKTIAGWHDDGR